MTALKVAKVSALPTTFEPNTLYFILGQIAGSLEVHLSDDLGVGTKCIITGDKIIASSYDEPDVNSGLLFWQNYNDNRLYYRNQGEGYFWSPIVTLNDVIETAAVPPTDFQNHPFWMDANGVLHASMVSNYGQYAPVNDAHSHSFKIAVATSELNFASGQFFNLDNTSSGSKAVTFAGLPTARAVILYLKIKGNADTVSYPNTVTWSDGSAPVLGSVFTIIEFFWDGTDLTGKVRQSA